MMRYRRWLALASIMLWIALAAHGEDEKPKADCDLTSWFSWLDRTFPPISGKPFIRITQDASVPHEPEWPIWNGWYGVLLEDGQDDFSVLTLDLVVARFRNRADPSRRQDRGLTHVPEDLRRIVRVILDERTERSPSNRSSWVLPQFRLEQITNLTILAWMCSRAGFDDLVRELVVRGRSDAAKPVERLGLDLPLQFELANRRFRHAIREYEGGDANRSEFLLRLQDCLALETHFGPDARELEELVRVLGVMVQEDAEHRHPAAGTSLSPEDKIRDLIYHLRDQHGGAMTNKSACEFYGPPGEELASIGLAAVPALIEALQDPRLTRMVEDLGYGGRGTVIRVGDAAIQVLERIAGRQFLQRHLPTRGILLEGELLALRRDVEAWWGETVRLGDEVVLGAAVRSGDDRAAESAERLLVRAPAHALDAIMAGAQAAKTGWTRAALVRLVRRCDSEAVIPFLIAELSGPYLSSRVAAAAELQERGRAEALPAMMREWEALPPTLTCSICVFEVDELADLLLSHADAAMLARIEEGFAARPLGARGALIDHLGSRVTFSKAVDRFEKLLAIALCDREHLQGIHRSRKGPSSVEPRICDLAAESLAAAFPQLYRFSAEAVEVERDRDILEMRNVWLRRAAQPTVAAVADAGARRVTVEAEVPQPHQSLCEIREILEARPLPAEALCASLRELVGKLYVMARRFDLTISRASGAKEMTAHLYIGGGVPASPREKRTWSSAEVVFAGNRALLQQTSSGDVLLRWNGNEFGAAVREVLALPAGIPFEIRLRFTEESR